MMEQKTLEEIQKQIDALEERIRRLENIAKGSTNKKAGRKEKLTLEQKNEIILKHTKGIPYAALSEEYHVAKGTISKVCKGYDNGNSIVVIGPD